MSVKGEKYASKSMKKRHEMMEGSKERKMEYGSAKAGLFGGKTVKKSAKKAVAKKMGKKK